MATLLMNSRNNLVGLRITMETNSWLWHYAEKANGWEKIYPKCGWGSSLDEKKKLSLA